MSENKCQCKNRVDSIDFIKGWLIILVVTAHFVEYFRNCNPYINAAFYFIYLFHMPLFIICMGIVRSGKSDLDKNLLIYIEIYFVMQFIYFLYRIVVQGYKITGILSIVKGLILPFWHMWYLLAMIIWILLLPVLYALRKYRVFTTALVIALCIAGGYLGLRYNLPKIISFFPFFVIGYYWGEEIKLLINKLENKKALKIAGVALLIVALVCVFFLQDKINYAVLLGSQSYKAGKYLPTDRFLLYIVSFLLSAIWLVIFAGAKSKYLCNLGRKGTMTVFVLHGLIFHICNDMHINQFVLRNSFLIIPYTVVMSAIVVTVLSSKPVVTAFDKIFSVHNTNSQEK